MEVFYGELEKRLYNVFIQMGLNDKNASLLADSFLFSHVTGKHEHGIGRIPLYWKRVKCGVLMPCNEVTMVSDFAATSVLDACNGFGQIASCQAIELAKSKAMLFGIGVVGIRNSNNFGIASFISAQALSSDMIGIVMTNASPSVSVEGISTPMVGTNPISFAFPSNNEGNSIVFDMSCSVVSKNKVLLAKRKGEEISDSWVTSDGCLQPIGGYKGLGLSMCIDLLSGLLTGSSFGKEVFQFNDCSHKVSCGHLVIVIDVKRFMSIEEYKDKITDFIDYIESFNTDIFHVPGKTVLSFFDKKIKEVFVPDDIYHQFLNFENSIGRE